MEFEVVFDAEFAFGVVVLCEGLGEEDLLDDYVADLGQHHQSHINEEVGVKHEDPVDWVEPGCEAVEHEQYDMQADIKIIVSLE